MKTYRTSLIMCAFTMSVVSLLFSSCKEDEPPAKPKLSFDKSSLTVNEGDGEIEIKLKLDKGAFEDFTIAYELTGTAVDKVSAGTTKAYDYEISSDYLETEIDKDDSIGIIKIKLYSDLSIEEDEMIQISIKDTDSENIEITRNDDIKITVKQEDGMVVALQWGIGAGEKYTDVDMDLFLWAKGTTGVFGLTNIQSASAGFASPEYFFLPVKPFAVGSYGLSCNYYEGKQTPMNFVVSYIKIVGGAETPAINKKGTYTLVNVNPYDVTKVDPKLVMTFDKVGTDFTNFSEITPPSEKSRMSSGNSSTITLKKGDDSKNKPFTPLVTGRSV